MVRTLRLAVVALALVACDAQRMMDPLKQAARSLSPDTGPSRALAGEVWTSTPGSNGLAPAATFTGPTTGAEGSLLTFDASSSSDPTGAPLTSYSWTFGDGGTATGPVARHAYADNGVYAVIVVVTDATGGTASYGRNVTISNIAPTATFVFPARVDEGPNFTMSLNNPRDSRVDSLTLTFAFDCGAGLGAFTPSPSVSCPATENGRLFVHGVVRDKDGAETTYDGRVIVANVAPTARFNAPSAVRPGESFTLSLSNIVEPSPADTVSIEFDCGAGFVATTATSVVCPGVPEGSLDVHARLVDEDGGETIYDATIRVGQVPPTATLVAPSAVVEGSAISFSLTNADGAAPLTYSYACSATEPLRPSPSASFSCPTTDNSSDTVRARITDRGGLFTEYTQPVAVTNAAPVITSFTTPTATTVGTAVSATVTYTDASSVDTHSAVIAWGDGSTSTVNGAAGSATGTHSYAAAGSYTISVTVRDDDGGTATRTGATPLVVTAPPTSTGALKADGWLPAYGAWAKSQNYGPQHYGSNARTTFKVDVRNVAGAPRGFAFGSSADHIVATARTFDYFNVNGNTATLRGTGTLSDGTAIRFLFYAVDDKSAYGRDRVRIKITNKATGRLLYDTEPGVPESASRGTVIGGGYVLVTQ